MNLLICGDSLSQFTIDFAINLRNFDDIDRIDIVNIRPIKNATLLEKVGGFYDRVYNFQPLSKYFERIPKLRVLIRKCYERRIIRVVNAELSRYDVILIHGFWLKNCDVINRINLRNHFIVGTFWGSDLYKIKEKDLKSVKQTILKCNLLNLPNKKMIDAVAAIFPFDASNIRNCLFGLTPLETLSETDSMNMSSIKRAIDLNDDGFVITCGYNGSENQQHFHIIESIISSKEFLPEKYILLFPMTYGGRTDYRKEVERFLNESGLHYFIYDQFLSNLEVACLRKATNIFIQVQGTDSFSGSMQEHLFAQNIVITGKWLSYDILHENNIYFEEIEDIDNLPEKLKYVIQNYDELLLKVDTYNSSEKFFESFWSNSIIKWHNMLNEYKNYK